MLLKLKEETFLLKIIQYNSKEEKEINYLLL